MVDRQKWVKSFLDILMQFQYQILVRSKIMVTCHFIYRHLNYSYCWHLLKLVYSHTYLMSVDNMSVDNMCVDKMSVDKMSVDQMSVDKMSVDKMSVDKILYTRCL